MRVAFGDSPTLTYLQLTCNLSIPYLQIQINT